ncbi:mannose-1-phosphate guanylyltransferase/mannose-6-phosphate isomerase [Roseinatronobacter sp. S2]|uniref:mannose-1-phosphate guanylyltransferase/mannose-6-phosphate isomerase n=1 Tax=Roseinatronobacter sp. S2 TaxID=3035471 RepID=UPI00240F3ECA|nr:mannose-1-phosphate guanylyltransferase/mannose-6-phosphate isomerase [Roseinatronobacter sp. S2]WFE75350.1 mannose-1-phosphate guanylyltransferase/mannose-6-phosphate isomerase [Roseinatronobacter sp. S2]
MITPVILCGGSGTRLWPLSRKAYPKQFVPLVGDNTLFQTSALRASGDGFCKPLVITNSDFRFIVQDQLAAAGLAAQTIMIEPAARNTAPAVLAAALHAQSGDPDAVLLVAPSDHVVPDAAAFVAAVHAGMRSVEQGRLVTFGITPTYPETGYGYLELAQDPKGEAGPVALSRFVEKPDMARAQQMQESGKYLWNSGIFLFRARDIIAAFHQYMPDMLQLATQAVADAQEDIGFLRLAPEPWAQIEDISIDHAVMEKADNLSVVPFAAGWSDLGGWDAVWREGARDAQGVQISGAATSIDCEDTLLRSDSDDLELVGIGLKDMVVVAMNDAVLVADKSRAQDVKLAVAALKKKGAKQATELPKDHRPWGWFESLALGSRFQVKRIHVHPGAALSLQSHFHRSEHWIVVEGTAKVTVDTETRLVTENQSIYIPLGAVHRMENPGKVPMVLIEVQTGSYVGEDDIVRYEDKYARGQGAKG